MDIWRKCKDKVSFINLTGVVYRVVESQEQVATNRLVKNLEEQAVLEQLLESSKNKINAEMEQLHYLLYSPFRYPPLPYGSRFGNRFEPSLFYGSQKISTALTESAYYRFVFWFGMSEPPPSAKLKTQHTVFAAKYQISNGVQLQHMPFEKFLSYLVSPVDYTHTQKLGSQLRAAGVEGFEYICARSRDHEINVALFSPYVFADKKPHDQQQWLCETVAENISYFNSQSGEVLNFPLALFLVEGKLPQPAVL